jgi:hypothetical protein
MAEQGVLEVLLTHVVKALRPLVRAAEKQPPGSGIIRLTYEVGYDLGPTLDPATANSFAGSISGIYTGLRDIIENPNGFAEQLPDLVGDLKTFVDTVKTLDDVAPPNADVGRKLFEYLLISYIERESPSLKSIFVLFGIFVYQDIPAAGTAPAYTKRTIDWDRFGDLLNPDRIFKELYHWGDANLDSDLLLQRVGDVLWSLGLPASRTLGPAANDDVLTLGWTFEASVLTTTISSNVRYLPPSGTSLPGLAMTPSGLATVDQTIPFGGDWQFGIFIEVSAESGYGVFFRPPGELGFGDLTGQPLTWDLIVRLSVGKAAAAGERVILFGPPDSSRLEATSVTVTGLVQAGSDGGDMGPELNVVGGRLVVSAGSADSFLQKVLPPEGISLDFEIRLGWSAKRGLYFQGSAGIETTLPINLNLGPLRIESLYLRLRTLDTGQIGLTAAASPTIDLDVIVASVDRIGMEVLLTLGPSPHLEFAFSPPTALGILIDAGAVAGGGFLSFDHPNGRYAGILQLQIYSVSLTAIGLLDTKLPGGKPGFSFLIIITAKFPPIQLGFGFTLNGAGGLAGINRTIVIDALQAGVRSGAVDYLLFPEDPIRDAAIIISDLRTFFPPVEGRYVFGPIALIGYGTPTLLDIELGIIIEVPSPIRLVLLGQLNAFLPQPDAAVVELHIDVLGVIDFGAKRMSIDATLRDSRVAAFSLYGDMAMRLAWGDKPSFALAVGGWNPHFTPPAGFPELRRLTVALGDGENPRITLKGYFALTSNSVQVGARAELYAAKGGFNISGWIGFDAIFIFDPFSFRTDFSAGVALKRGNSTIASIHLDATLTGTSPYHAWGKASFSVLFFSVSVPFDAKFGATRTIAPPERDPWELLEPAIREQQNWTAELPPGAFPIVSLRTPPVGAPPVLLDPVGSAALRQKVVPLDFTLSKFGEATPLGPDHYTVTEVTVQGTATTAYTDVEDLFARGQFRKLSDHQKLTLPSFEPLVAGIRLSAKSVTLGQPQGRNVVFETIILDSEYESRPQPAYAVPLRQQLAATAISAASLSDLSMTGLGRFAPDPRLAAPFALDEETYVVASTDELIPNTAITEATTMGRAYDALEEYLANHPEERGAYQVVSLEEVTAGV